MKNQNLVLLILCVISSTIGSILKISQYKFFGDILLIMGSILFIYLLIYFIKNRKLQ